MGTKLWGIKLWVFVVSFVIWMVAQAHAQNNHSTTDPKHWYPSNCCTARDCDKLDINALRETKDGWWVHFVSEKFGEVNEFVARRHARPSQDGEFHGCWRLDRAVKPRMICFFEPVNS